jgi:hypothetical protein
MEGPVNVSERRPKIRRVPEATYFPADADRREERPLTELQGVTMEDQ